MLFLEIIFILFFDMFLNVLLLLKLLLWLLLMYDTLRIPHILNLSLVLVFPWILGQPMIAFNLEFAIFYMEFFNEFFEHVIGFGH